MKKKKVVQSAVFRRCSMVLLGLLSVQGISPAIGATTTIFTENFDSYTGPATSLEDTASANPAGPQIIVTDDNPVGSDAGTGVQLINWLANSGSQSLLVRSGSEAQVQIQRPQSGATYQLDFNLNVVKGEGDRGFYIIVRAMGADTNGEDFMAYRSDRAAGNAIFYYDGIFQESVTGGWIPVGVENTENEWQHHRFVFDMRTLTFDLYIDDMTTPVVEGGDLSRTGAAVPTSIILRHEGNSADDGYFAIDDISLTVEDSRDLSTAFNEGFESYPAVGVASQEDANPQGPWITNEADGTGDARPIMPTKVQVVDSTVVPPHSGTKSLKLEGGQRAGVSFAWGNAPQSDIQVTWWARVPASVPGQQATYLRMSLYGLEGGRADQGDGALLGYGSRDATVGDETSLTIFTTAWQDTPVDYTPDTWEEYRLITHVEQGSYTIIKNPNGENPEIIADRAPFIGSATSWGPFWMIGFSSSNGNLHPPVYVDDIQIVSLTSSVDPIEDPYTVKLEGSRFTNVTSLKIQGPVGDIAVDPRDNSTIFFAVDGAPGGIYKASKVSPGTWEVDETPIVAGLDRPSGLTVDSEGTIWWTHDFSMALMRLKAPYASNTPETIISNFGPGDTDDDPIDVTIAPSNFANTPNYIVVADRGTDNDNDNTLYLVDPATTDLNQVGYENYLIPPSSFTIGALNINAIAPIPGTGEIALVNADAFIYAVDGSGNVRAILPNIYADPSVAINPTAIGVDPTTSRIWLADDVFKQIWSISSDPTPDEEILEVSFELKEDSRPDSNIDFHDPGLTFSADGKIMVVSDTSTGNGGGRIHIFHNEASMPPTDVNITRTAKTAAGVEIEWSAAGNATYKVQRANNVTGTFEDVSGVLTEPRYTDANPPADHAFYRVVVLQ